MYYNNFAVSADGDRLEGQRPLSGWGHDVDLEPESGFGRLLLNTGISIPDGPGNEFLRAWQNIAGPRSLGEYHHRDVPIYDGAYVWWGRSLTGYAFARGGGDGLPLPEVGEYIIPICTTRNLTVVEDPQIERVTDHWTSYSINTERHQSVRMWLEMPTGWRPEGSTDVETPTEEAERPLQVGDVVRIRPDYPQEKVPATWREVASTFRARVERIEEGRLGWLTLTPLVDRPDGFGRLEFTWQSNGAWERVEGEGEGERTPEPTTRGRTAEEWKERWDRFWQEGTERARDRGYWRAFTELAEEMGVDIDQPYHVEVTLQMEVRPSLGNNSGRVGRPLLESILRDALRERNIALERIGMKDRAIPVEPVSVIDVRTL